MWLDYPKTLWTISGYYQLIGLLSDRAIRAILPSAERPTTQTTILNKHYYFKLRVLANFSNFSNSISLTKAYLKLLRGRYF